MFIALLFVCATQDLSSCEVLYNTKQVFITEEACRLDLDNAVALFQSSPVAYLRTSCLKLPGESS